MHDLFSAAADVTDKAVFDGEHSVIVDLHLKAVFEEFFYVTLLEKTKKESVRNRFSADVSKRPKIGTRVSS